MDVMESLYRDQRTVRVRCEMSVRTCECGAAADPQTRHRQTHRPKNTPVNTLLRLGEVLTISACLLSLVQWPTAMSAPTSRHRIPADHPRLWVNPCGFYEASEEQSPQIIETVVSDVDMLQTIIVQASNALLSVEGFKNEYVRETFNVDFASHHNTWKEQRYEWLLRRDQVPKNLGQQTHPEHLRKIELDDFLRDAYRFLQVMAVALEQVAWDQDHHNSGSAFVAKFKDVEYKLRAVLCEIQMAMIERGVRPHDDVDRSVMSDDFRYLKDDTTRPLRDWIIFRDYMIVLEYIKDVFQFFCDNPTKIKEAAHS